MLLKIILVIVFVKLGVDLFWSTESKEPFVEPPILNKITDGTPSEACNTNIQFPNPVYYTNEKNEKIIYGYNNENNYIYNNFSNILKAANPEICQ